MGVSKNRRELMGKGKEEEVKELKEEKREEDCVGERDLEKQF